MNKSSFIRAVLIFMMVMFFLLTNLLHVLADETDNLPGCEGIVNGRVLIGGEIIRWENAAAEDDIDRLKSWCRAVGPPLYIQRNNNKDERPKVDELVVVSWNIKVGGGDLHAFIRDLRKGNFNDGKAVEHFIILLQEVFRAGPDIPRVVTGKMKTGRSIRPLQNNGLRRDIADIAQEYNLNLFYVPAMRNGGMNNDLPAEDRGIAILSTMPLMSPAAVELPLERQRRLAITGNVSLFTSKGNHLSLQIVNVHLENRAKWLRFFRSFGEARLNQVKAITGMLPLAEHLIIAGDFNTWSSGPDEPAIRYLDTYMKRADANAVIQNKNGNSRNTGIPLDYIFYRLPEKWPIKYSRINDRYGSDHSPVLLKAFME